jgi:hypothetical protein
MIKYSNQKQEVKKLLDKRLLDAMLILMSELEQLKEKLREYLKLGSCDGRVERRKLREELCKLLGSEYDSKTHSIKE